MTVHASVLELLSKSETVSYSITPNLIKSSALSAVPDTSEDCLVRGLIFRNADKKPVQVLVAENRLVDLNAIARHCQQSLEAMPSGETWALIKDKGLRAVPAVPDWQAFDTLVDQHLFTQNSLLLDAGDGSSLIKVNANNFAGMTQHCQKGGFSSALRPSSAAQLDDEQHILNSVSKFTERRIQTRLADTLELPALPETAQRIIELRSNPNSDISDLTNIVEIDPSLAAQVVGWAASPYYSAPGKIKSVHDAIVRVLGFDMVLNLALGLALGKSINTKTLTKNEIKQFWCDAVHTAAAMEGLVTSIAREHRPSFGLAYLAGLLNSFGYLVMAEIFPPYMDTVRRSRAANAHLSNATIESHTLGVGSHQIGGWLLANWSLPDEVVTALRYQHDISYQGEHAVYANLMFIAKQMLANRGFGDRLPAHIPDHLFESLHLDREMAEATIGNILDCGDDLNCIAEKLNA